MPKPTTVYTDAQGNIVPAQYVKTYDKQRDRIARKISAAWLEQEVRLRKLKADTIEAIEQLRDLAAAEAGVKPLGGKEGNIQFRSFDGSITISMDNAKRTEFDERLAYAQQLIMEAVKEIASDVSNADLIEIATRAFQPRRSGALDMQRIRDLKNYKVTHPKWNQAIEIIKECERVIGHKRYIRVSVRDAGGKPINVILDIAAL